MFGDAGCETNEHIIIGPTGILNSGVVYPSAQKPSYQSRSVFRSQFVRNDEANDPSSAFEEVGG